jgi:hypothetical protein
MSTLIVLCLSVVAAMAAAVVIVTMVVLRWRGARDQ